MIKVIENIFSICRIKKRYILLNLIGILLISLMEIASIGIIFPFLSLLTKNQSNLFENNSYLDFISLEVTNFEKNIYLGVIFILLIFFIKNILIILISYLQKKSFYNIQKKIKYIAIESHLVNGLKNNTNTAIIVRDIDYINDIYGWLSLTFGLISEFIILLSIFCFLLVFNFNVSISLFLFLILLALLFKFFLKKKINEWSVKNNTIKKVYYRTFLDLIYGLKEIILFNKENFFTEKFKRNYDRNLDISLKVRILEIIPRPLIEMIFVTALASIVIFFYQKFKDINEFLPYLGVYFFAALRILPNITKIMTLNNSIRFVTKQVQTLKDISNNFEYKKNQKPQDKKYKINNLEKIVLKNCRVKLNKTTILEDINLEINNNTFYGLIGKSGSGKTTFLNLISGLITPEDGEFKVNNIDFTKNLHNWTQNVAVVPQNVFILNETLRQNIAFGEKADEIDDNKIKEAINQAELREFTENLPNKEKSIIEENGQNISGGEKQRIGIARALYRNPKLLLLDEPTSALDKETEIKFIETLNRIRKDKVIILSSHKIENLKYSDINIKVNDKTVNFLK